MERIPFTVIGGYLGAGKTTLLNNLLKGASRRIALLVNDFGEINIDAALIESQDDAQINLTNGCVCCTLTDGFYDAIDQLLSLSPPPDHIVVEASGVADVTNLAQYGHGHGLTLDGVIVLADAETVRAKADDKYVAQTVRRQLAAADVIVINKTNLVSESSLASLESWLADNFDEPRVLRACQADVPIPLLLGIHDGRELTDVDEAHAHYDNWLYRSEQAVSRKQLDAFLDTLDDNVIRLKGFVRGQGSDAWLVQCVGRRRSVVRVAPDGEGTRLVAIGLEGFLPVVTLTASADRCLG